MVQNSISQFYNFIPGLLWQATYDYDKYGNVYITYGNSHEIHQKNLDYVSTCTGIYTQ